MKLTRRKRVILGVLITCTPFYFLAAFTFYSLGFLAASKLLLSIFSIIAVSFGFSYLGFKVMEGTDS